MSAHSGTAILGNKVRASLKVQLTGVAFLAALACGGQARAAEPFRIGFVALPGEEAAIEGLSAIKAAYSAALGQPVEVMAARSYAALAAAQVAGRVDYGAYSAAAYAALTLRCGCVTPVAAPVDADGATGLRAVLIARRDGPGDGGVLAIGPGDSLATRLSPLAASPQAQEAAKAGRLVEAASALEAEALFLKGEVDGFFGWMPAGGRGAAGDRGAAGGGSLARLDAAGVERSSYRVVWRSELLRYGPHAVRNDLAPDRIARLARLLERAAGEDDGPGRHILRGHRGFAAVTAADYEPVIRALSALGDR